MCSSATASCSCRTSKRTGLPSPGARRRTRRRSWSRTSRFSSIMLLAWSRTSRSKFSTTSTAAGITRSASTSFRPFGPSNPARPRLYPASRSPMIAGPSRCCIWIQVTCGRCTCTQRATASAKSISTAATNRTFPLVCRSRARFGASKRMASFSWEYSHQTSSSRSSGKRSSSLTRSVPANSSFSNTTAPCSSTVHSSAAHTSLLRGLRRIRRSTPSPWSGIPSWMSAGRTTVSRG
mmetsp:Transcript_9331/g.29805  ORF Transcript_9331/g.29805 Transcript_9331/m.29805 type:complete len:236 (+) Transcript_9331:1451-2158(+)